MKYVTVIALMLLVLPITAAAQLGSATVVADVPFEFVAWNRVIPAGECSLQRASLVGSTLIIRNVDAKIGMFTLAVEDRKSPTGVYVLVFNKYANRHFLRQLKIADGTIYNLPESKMEREMLAQNVTVQQEILLASLK